MLIYLGTGERRYAENPLALQSRRAWEFQVALKGKIGPSLPEGAQPVRADCLWIFPPGHTHGWVGEKGRTSEVAVFHFQSAPELLTHLLNPQGFIEIELNRRSILQIREIASKVERYWKRPAPGMMICYEHALLTLSQIACEALQSEKAANNYNEARVNAAIVWYAKRMEEAAEELVNHLFNSLSKEDRLEAARLSDDIAQAEKEASKADKIDYGCFCMDPYMCVVKNEYGDNLDDETDTSGSFVVGTESIRRTISDASSKASSKASIECSLISKASQASSKASSKLSSKATIGRHPASKLSK